MDRAVLARRFLVSLVLQIVGEYQRRHPGPSDGDADGAVDQMPYLGRCGGLLHEGAGHILEHRLQVEFLLIVAAHRGTRLLANDCKYRLVVHAGIVEAGDHVRGTGSEVARQTPSRPVNLA